MYVCCPYNLSPMAAQYQIKFTGIMIKHNNEPATTQKVQNLTAHMKPWTTADSQCNFAFRKKFAIFECVNASFCL